MGKLICGKSLVVVAKEARKSKMMMYLAFTKCLNGSGMQGTRRFFFLRVLVVFLNQKGGTQNAIVIHNLM